MAISCFKIYTRVLSARLGLLFFVLLLFLVGCHHESWHCSFIRNGNLQHDLAKLTYAPSSRRKGIEFEIVRNGKEIYAYINVKQYKIPCYHENPYQALITIKTDYDIDSFVVPLLEGGQRIHLTDCCLNYLLQALENHPSVTLSVGSFSETLNTKNFKYSYGKILKRSYYFDF